MKKTTKLPQVLILAAIFAIAVCLFAACAEPVQYDVVFKADGVVVETLHYTTANDKITAPQVPAKVGYNGEWEQYFLTAGNVTVNAIYTAKKYTVLIDYDGATANNSQTSIDVTYGQKIGQLPFPSKPDNMFDGWLLGETVVDSLTVWTIDTQEQLTIKAQWKQLIATEGLLYELREDGQSYAVTGLEESSSATEIVIPSIYGDKPVTRIEDGAFVNSKIKSIFIPDSVISMGRTLFDPERLNKLYYSGNLSQWCNIVFDDMIFNFGSEIPKETNFTEVYIAGEIIVDLVIPDGVTEIGAYSFATMFNLKSVTIPSDVRTVENGAFAYCINLNSVAFCEGLETIGSSAFLSCPLKQAVLPDSLTRIGNMAFYSCGLQSVVIPSKVTEIERDAFSACFKLYEVYNLSNLKISAGSAENGCVAENAKYVYASLDEPSKLISVATDDGFEFLIDGEDVYLVGYNGSDTEVTLPKDLEGKRYAVSGLVFGFKTDITRVNIPKEVLGIDDYAFAGCLGLKDVYVAGDVSDWCKLGGIGNVIESYGINVYINGQKLSDLTSVVLSDEVTVIPDYAFYGCSKFTAVTLGRNVGKIEHYAFYGCGDIDTIYYEGDIAGWCVLDGTEALLQNENVTVYVNGEKLNDLISLTIPEGVKNINYYAFTVCSKLKELTISGELDSFLPFDNSPIEIATAPLSCLRWLPNANLKKVVVTKVDTDYWSGFNDCRALQTVVLCKDITSIESYAFMGCSSLTEIVYKGTVEQWSKIDLGDNWLYNCPVQKIVCIDGEVQL